MPDKWLIGLVGEGRATWIERFLKERWMLVGLILGQFVSLIITSTGFSSSDLARRGINIPTSQSFLNYVLLAIVYGIIVIRRKKWLKMPWYYYLLLGIIDVEANYLVVKAYQYTSLTSVMLLDCWSIPCVILFTWILLKTQYGIKKFIGVAICVAGLVLDVFSDVHAEDRAKGPNPLKGDMLVFAGATLYACSNVGEEYLVKKGDRIEVMAMLGVFGAIISAIQISIIERDALRSVHWTAGAAFPFFGFSLAMFVFYSTVPSILKIVGATILNLSLLTSDMWAVLIRIFAYNEKVDWIYFIAFACVAVGLGFYSWSTNKDERRAQVAVDHDEKSIPDEEAQVESSDQVAQNEDDKPKSDDAKHFPSTSSVFSK
jgi:solute carrier family 35 protein F1/2